MLAKYKHHSREYGIVETTLCSMLNLGEILVHEHGRGTSRLDADPGQVAVCHSKMDGDRRHRNPSMVVIVPAPILENQCDRAGYGGGVCGGFHGALAFESRRVWDRDISCADSSTVCCSMTEPSATPLSYRHADEHPPDGRKKTRDTAHFRERRIVSRVHAPDNRIASLAQVSMLTGKLR
ncbi:hypothetical protein BD414DRAFT_298283 [Trametes punicea]|nr:hypothetical protein BD414DRAFT_298283 [Trametes punicea]